MPYPTIYFLFFSPSRNLESLQRISTFSREKGDLRLNPAYGRRVSVRAGVGSFLLPSKRFLFASSSSPITERLVGALDWSHPPKVVPAWREDALAWRPMCEKIGLHVQVVIPGDGGYHRSVDASFFREVEASSASPPPVQVLGKGRYSLLRLRRF